MRGLNINYLYVIIHTYSPSPTYYLNINYLWVTVHSSSQSAAYSKDLEGAEGKVARALIGDDADSIAKAAMKIDDVKEAIIKQILRILNEECSRLCKLKENTPSQFRKIPVNFINSKGRI